MNSNYRKIGIKRINADSRGFSLLFNSGNWLLSLTATAKRGGDGGGPIVYK